MQVTTKVSRINDNYKVVCEICGKEFEKPTVRFMYKSHFIQYIAKNGWSWHQLNGEWGWVCQNQDCKTGF